jgi:cold shock CspA family protein
MAQPQRLNLNHSPYDHIPIYFNHNSDAIVDIIHFKDHIIAQRIEGTIIWYSPDQGYGIIRQNLNKKTISIDQTQIHYNSLRDIRPLSIGQKVSFVIDNSIAQDLYLL